MKYSNAKFIFCLKYTKVLCLKSIFIFLISACANGSPILVREDTVQTVLAKDDSILVGAQNIEELVALIGQKRVGVVGNQSSMVDDKHLVDTLLSFGVMIKSVFSPEHGFRGKADAGEHVKNNVDTRTGLPIVSLYGSNKKPTDEQLKNIEVLIFDIQDVGVRFYTYISTLHYVMEAAAENEIEVIVLDRPNPNGHYVDGPVLDMKFTSFVGMHPIPIVHGMTIGEYALMINGEKWMKNHVQCKLTVLPCENYTHNTPYSLPIPPSPNLRSDVSIQLYPSLCLLEATTVTIGRGTDGPFERYGHPQFHKTQFSFTPKPGPGSKNPKHKNKLCNGFNLNLEQYKRMSQLDLSFLIKANEMLNGELFVDRSNFFNLLAGNDILLQQLKSGSSEKEIRHSWQEDLDRYREMRQQYLLYK
ncbi:MAG: DUF1343 domain-containing protein [Flavobacteriales bacterium]|nr:DUF1343 domain-containing protein [Flavobacteriales bacterium]